MSKSIKLSRCFFSFTFFFSSGSLSFQINPNMKYFSVDTVSHCVKPPYFWCLTCSLIISRVHTSNPQHTAQLEFLFWVCLSFSSVFFGDYLTFTLIIHNLHIMMINIELMSELHGCTWHSTILFQIVYLLFSFMYLALFFIQRYSSFGYEFWITYYWNV